MKIAVCVIMLYELPKNLPTHDEKAISLTSPSLFNYRNATLMRITLLAKMKANFHDLEFSV